MIHVIYSRAVYADMIASRPGPAEPEDRSLIVRAANRPRDVRDPERTVIESGVQSAPGNPVEPIRSVSGASETVPSLTCRPGALMRMVASGLPVAGQDGFPPWTEDGRFLAITGLDNMHCQVALNDDGEVLFEWWPATGSHADPVRIAPLIRKILGEETENWRPESRRYCGLTLKGTVGRALKDSGLDVGMAVYDDPHNYEVFEACSPAACPRIPPPQTPFAAPRPAASRGGGQGGADRLAMTAGVPAWVTTGRLASRKQD